MWFGCHVDLPCQCRCPDPKCGAPLAPGVLQRVLSPDDYSRWEQLTLQRTLDTMPSRTGLSVEAIATFGRMLGLPAIGRCSWEAPQLQC